MPDRQLALDRGARAERTLGYAELLHVAPAAYALDEIRATLTRAVEADPTLADPHWDLAVVCARFTGDYQAAAKHLAAAREQGDQHPMMDKLEALIMHRPTLSPEPTDAAARLRRLLLDLASQAESPAESLLHSETCDDSAELLGDPAATPRPASFGQYLREARALCAGGELSEAQAQQVLAATSEMAGDTREYAQDLLRRLSLDLAYPAFREAATEAHLRTLAQQAMAVFAPRPAAARRSRRAAQRGLAALELAPWLKGSELHADLLIACGQGLYYESAAHHQEAIACYQQAYRFKRSAGNEADAARLGGLLGTQVRHWMGKAVLGGVIGLEAGQSAATLRLCVEVADDLGDSAMASAARLALGDLLHSLGQHDASEAVLQELLTQAPTGPLQWEARFTLASIFSETGRPRAAAALQEALIADLGQRDERLKSVLWSNYANSLRLIGDLDRAATALDNAWQCWTRANPSPPPDKPSTEYVRLKLLFGQLARERGDLTAALAYLDEAGAGGDPAVFGLEQARIAELKAATLLAARSYGPAAELLTAATQNLRAVLARGHSFESWESLFRRWSSLDEMSVHAEARSAGPGHSQEQALLRAETAKGRVMSWLSTRDVAAAPRVLDPQRQVDALARARSWLAAKPGRRVVSLFAGSRGVGVFAVGDGAAVQGGWLDDVDYTALRESVFLPFEQAADDALSQGDAALARVSSALLEHLLAQVGAWLWRALPSLAEGGSELVLLPHRVLRALPLAHSMLPTGRRLSELFDSVWTAPTLELAFAEAPLQPTEQAGAASNEIQAVVDADGSLPFAACEALASTDPAHVRRALDASSSAVTDALGGPRIALVSMHGEFVPDDPFEQRILTSDGAVHLRDLLLQDTAVRAPVVLLGVCEAGQQRRSVSDEPFGFPAMLLQCGATAVLAPLWKVDDFASLHFMTQLAASLHQGVAVEQAALRAARWMCQALPGDVIRATDEIVRTVASRLDANEPLLASIRARVSAQRTWLDALPRDARPFGGAIDWAAFQVTRKVHVAPSPGGSDA